MVKSSKSRKSMCSKGKKGACKRTVSKKSSKSSKTKRVTKKQLLKTKKQSAGAPMKRQSTIDMILSSLGRVGKELSLDLGTFKGMDAKRSDSRAQQVSIQHIIESVAADTRLAKEHVTKIVGSLLGDEDNARAIGMYQQLQHTQAPVRAQFPNSGIVRP